MSAGQRDERRLGEEQLLDLREALLDWYAREKRDLPWRRTRDSYAIWVSEAMLQQTRVETVIPYWERFLERFPRVADLAAADDESLLAAWSGLGYYRRARSLRAAAQVIADEHDGAFPRELDAALALPGVGPYTAAAVLSIAHDVSVPVVDGNVLRVFSRWFVLEDAVDSSSLAREVRARAEELVPPSDEPGGALGPGAWNQAVMELGATVCTPRSPKCLLCPVVAGCEARALGREEELPRPGKKAEPIDVRLEVLVVRDGDQVLLQRRAAGGRMAGLWELPTREVTGGESRLWPTSFQSASKAAATDLATTGPLAEVSHGITRHRIRATVLEAEGSAPDPGASGGLAGEFVPIAEVQDRGLTGMTKKILRRREVRAIFDDSGSGA